MIIRRQVMFSDRDDAAMMAAGAGSLVAGAGAGYGTYRGIKAGARKGTKFLKNRIAATENAKEYMDAVKAVTSDGGASTSKRTRAMARAAYGNEKMRAAAERSNKTAEQILKMIEKNPKAAKAAGITTAGVAGLGLAAAGVASARKLGRKDEED